MKKPTQKMIVAAHSRLIAQTGGIDGIRDAHLLDQSINSSFHTFDGQYLYPTLEAMAAHLAFSLIKNHPFLDGNKRIGILAMTTFLERNGHPIICTDDELERLGWGLANGSISEPELLEWVVSHT